MKNVTVVENPFTKYALSYLRDKNTPTEKFRFYSDRLSQVLIAHCLDGLLLSKEEIETPLTKTLVEKISQKIIIIPIFRAGIVMLSSALSFFPHAQVGFVGLERNEKTAIAKEYYWKIPEVTGSIVVITDPMLATGGSILHVLKKLETPKEVRIVCVIAVPEGIAAVHNEFPDVTIITGAIDQKLNNQKYIIPGLGDYGDRYFGT